VVSVLGLADVARRPALFSTFLMWVLAELFEQLPEVGDPDRPVLVFFFDEAHLLFDDASDAFLDAVAQTVRLIRSKGVGVFFVTQLPTDLPDEVLSQLGHRVQHAVRAFTPKDARALDRAVETFPTTEHYDLAETLRSLGVGEAAVTVLDPRGVPTPVAATRIYPPASRMSPLTPEERAEILAASPIRGAYAERIDRESAAELLEARAAGDEAREREVRERARPAPRRRSAPPPDESLAGQVQDVLDSRVGRQVTREVVRGIFGMLRRGRR
jgi:DNA helicase HerA-like ATPase